ncbi:MAG: hypothetical protein AAF658_16795, partial [Myxococcota bacterium]
AFSSTAVTASSLDVLADDSGRIVVGTDTGVFWTTDPRLFWTEVPGLSGLDARSLAFTDGSLWVGTNDFGLFRTDWPPE